MTPKWTDLLQAGHLWAKHKHREGTRRLVEREMHTALDSNDNREVAYDSDSDTEVRSLLIAPSRVGRRVKFVHLALSQSRSMNAIQ